MSQPNPVPAPHSGEGRERHPTWLELFYDLVFVVAISKLSSTLATDVSWAGFGRFALLFVPIWWAWVGQTFYLTCFDTDDLRQRLNTIAQMAFVAVLAVVIPKAYGEQQLLFALFYAGLRLLLVAAYVVASVRIEAARPLTVRYALGFATSASLWLASTLLDSPYAQWLWLVAIAVDFATPLSVARHVVQLPPHSSHLPERFGLLTIIVLGEAVAAVVHGMGEHDLHGRGFQAGIAGLAIVFALWWTYFDAIRGAGARGIAGLQHVRRYQIWMYSHLPLAMAITASSVGIMAAIAAVAERATHAHQPWLLAAAAGCAMLAMHAIGGSRDDHGARRGRDHLGHGVCTAMTFASGWLGERWPPQQFLLVVAACAAGHVVIAERRRAQRARAPEPAAGRARAGQ